MVSVGEVELKLEAAVVKIASQAEALTALGAGQASTALILDGIDGKLDEVKLAFEALREQLGGSLPESVTEKLAALEAGLEAVSGGIAGAVLASEAATAKASALLEETDAVDAEPAPA